MAVPLNVTSQVPYNNSVSSYGISRIVKVGSAYYAFTADAAYKSTAPDTSWSEVDSANAPTETYSDFQIDIIVDGTTIHIISHERTNNDATIKYHSFNTSTDTWGTTDETIKSSYSGSSTVAFSDYPRSQQSAALRGDGTIVVAYSGAPDGIMGTNYSRAYVAYGTPGGTWTTDVRTDDNGKVEEQFRFNGAIKARDSVKLCESKNLASSSST